MTTVSHRPKLLPMKRLNKLQSMVFAAGAVLMVVGAAASLLRWDAAPWLFAAGAVAFTSMQMLQSYEGRDLKQLSRSERDGLTYLRDRVEKAQSFIEALRQRHQTLTSTMRAILTMQRPFFESGDETLLRPMTLEDVAGQTGLHLSTISRVSNAKWVQTPFGIYPLKWFFTSAARLQDGDDVSVRAIKATLKDIVQAEDKRAPLSDEALAQELQNRGFAVARRTVAKYREQLNIPIARLRK